MNLSLNHLAHVLKKQYVCQQLKTIDGLNVYYYTNDRGSCEVDFVIDTGEQVIPVEVKAEVNLKAKSLKTYLEKFQPELAVRTSMADYRKEERLVNLPLYAVEEINEVISETESWKNSSRPANTAIPPPTRPSTRAASEGSASRNRQP